jgi:3-dehydroquinate dehydratase
MTIMLSRHKSAVNHIAQSCLSWPSAIRVRVVASVEVCGIAATNPCRLDGGEATHARRSMQPSVRRDPPRSSLPYRSLDSAVCSTTTTNNCHDYFYSGRESYIERWPEVKSTTQLYSCPSNSSRTAGDRIPRSSDTRVSLVVQVEVNSRRKGFIRGPGQTPTRDCSFTRPRLRRRLGIGAPNAAKMATTHAGVKRSFQQMHNIEASPGRVTSAANSRETSPRSRTPQAHRPTDTIESLGNFAQVTPTVLPRQSSFEPDASVVLVGVKGVGKSSLGVLAASAYRRRLIESERVFFDTTGHTAAAYRKLKGSAEYHRRHHEILGQLLDQHPKNAIIVLNFADLENSGADILRAYAQTHPVIHVMRDAKSVSTYLNLWAEDRVKQLLRLSGPLLRSCANYDFFNLSAEEPSEDGAQLRASDEQAYSARSPNGPFLTLKRAERDFLRLLRNIIGDHDRGPSHQSAYPLSQIPVERRTYTYGVVVEINRVLRGEVELEDAQIGADAIEVIVPVTGIEGAASASEPVGDPNLIAKAFAMVRRASILPIILTVAKAENENEADRARRLELGQIFLRLGPEYCTVDMHLGDATIGKIASGKGRTKVIGYKHFPSRLLNGWNDSELVFTYHNMHRLGCDLVKISMVTNREMDNFEVKQFKRRIREDSTMPRLICYNTGLIGRTSLCFNYVLSPVRPRKDEASLTLTGDCTPLVTAKELTHALFAIFKHEPMHYHIYGRDVSWSLSPAMHNAAYAACGMSHEFTTFSSPSLDELERLIHEHNFGGSAVVQPYKTSVVPLMTVLSAHAKAIGAVNSIIPIRELLDDGTVPDELRIMSSRNRSGPVKALWGDNTGKALFLLPVPMTSVHL